MFGTFEDISDLMISKKLNLFTSFGLQYNLQCNAKCACCYDLDEPRDNFLDNTNAERWIAECGELDIFISINTGEPFLHWKWFKDFFIPTCKKYNTKYIFYTNGFWGKDQELLKDISSHCKNISISVDWWHQQFISLESINAILQEYERNENKLFISTVYNDEHPIEEVYFPSIEDKLMYFYYHYIYNRWDNEENVFTHDFNGNIIYHQKIVGKSIKNIQFNENASFRIEQFKDSNNYYIYKRMLTDKKNKLYKEEKSLCFVLKKN